MNAAAHPAPMPAPAIVHAALGRTTERLAHELAEPQPYAPQWSQFDWVAARAVVAMHGISGLLAAGLRWQGPPEWQEFLTTQRAHLAARQGRIAQLLERIDLQLKARGTGGLALKGAALHALGLYQTGERPMADVDLLVRPQDLDAATAALAALELHESHRTVKHRVFITRQTAPVGAFGEHAGNQIKVELHERLCEFLPLQATDITAQVLPGRLPAGLNAYPSRAALMGHLLLHAAGSTVYRVLRLIQLHDLTLLGRSMSESDWQELLAWRPWWALPTLALAEHYYEAFVPTAAMDAFRHCSTRPLRRAARRQRLSDVSLSRLWVDAFPGIEWSRSAGEALQFMVARLIPSAQLRADRQMLNSEPSLAHDDWAHLSQRRRIARFLSSRPSRPWPMYNVRAALTQHF